MAIDFLYPQYEVVRNPDRCIACRVCERQCANEVHRFDPERGVMRADDAKCVNCHRCVSLCPTRALKIVKSDHTFKENANWPGEAIQEIQAAYCCPPWAILSRFPCTGTRFSSTLPR